MAPDIDLRERAYVSQFATDIVGLAIVVNDVLTDVDSNVMHVAMTKEDDNSTIFTGRVATHASLGKYETRYLASDTAKPGLYTLTWSYTIGSVAQAFDIFIQVGEAAPNYDPLNADMKGLVDLTWARFADLFDSPNGGPNLMTYFQTHFTRNRMAELLRIAVGTLNTVAQPHETFTLDGVGGSLFPVATWGSLLERSLYIECIKHLRRSYVEQPAFVGGSVTRLDRRDYLERWGAILQDEEAYFKSQLDTFKIAMMFLGRPAVLVSGGVYGRYGPTRVAGSIAARPRYYTRWY